ncbi:T-lymphocyte activation antigen CD80 isoform X2 [Hoplias malabaricus]|uniref:T-lymphocyte activation antigen CD80 isoform X2 n=1 Tax=Hoplias malabaricus TaxID=27720 RepID=UPI00346183E1
MSSRSWPQPSKLNDVILFHVNICFTSVHMEPQFYKLLLLLLSVLQPVISDKPTVLDLRGTVGGRVTMTCLMEEQKPSGIFFQKKNVSTGEYTTFVNGFYTEPVENNLLEQYKKRTSANRVQHSMDMWDLVVSDEGEYICLLMYSSKTIRARVFNLTLTANYSVPTVTKLKCSNHDNGTGDCEVSCWSAGGYPRENMVWTVSEGSDSFWQTVKNSSSEDKQTGLWNISQTVRISCTQSINYSCSVGGAVSVSHTICIKPGSEHTVEITVAVVLLFIFISILAFFGIKKLCRRHQPPFQDPSVELPLNRSHLLDQEEGSQPNGIRA